ncbi:MAG: TadE/TadG family type IV pilus assembly protein, partial [Steroidobacter sp.]
MERSAGFSEPSSLAGEGRREGKRGQRGAAIVEAVIALPILIVVILGAIQFGLIYQAKATLNHAGLQSARAGAVENADPNAIRRGLARGLASLYSPESSLTDVIAAVARIHADLMTDARIRILNPTREAFADFGEEVGGVREIPNDRLHARSTTPGAQSGLNIQDANILRVEITYGYELKVPLVNWFITRTLLALRGDRRVDAFEQQLLRRTLLPVVTTATVRMQTPARISGLVVALADLPDVNRFDAASQPPDEDEEEEDESDNEEGNGDSGERNVGDSSLGDGFLGYGGGPA